MLKSGTGRGAVILVVNTTSLGPQTAPFFLLVSCAGNVCVLEIVSTEPFRDFVFPSAPDMPTFYKIADSHFL